MCKAKTEGGHRCPVNERTRKMAAARRRVLRTSKMLKEPAIAPARKQVLFDRLLTARIELQNAKDQIVEHE